jgi:hypothetical protein
MDYLKGVCEPALIYFWVLVILNVINFLNSRDLEYLIVSLLLISVITYIINKLCNTEHNIIAWALALIPVVSGLSQFLKRRENFDVSGVDPNWNWVQ